MFFDFSTALCRSADPAGLAGEPVPTFRALTAAISFSVKASWTPACTSAVGADAGLAGVAVLGGHRAVDRRIQIGVVEDDERSIAAQFQADLLHRGGGLSRRQPTEYLTYGLEVTTDPSWVTAASAIIDAHCRRATLGVNQYEERLKMPPELNTVRVSYLPLVAVAPATTPIVTLQGRYGIPRRGEWPFPELSLDFALVFALPGAWTVIDPSTIDIWTDSGELTFPVNALGLFFNEVDVVYNAGLGTIRRV